MNEMSLRYRDYFDKSYTEHGENVMALGWNAKSQRQRFEVLAQVGDLTGKNILDAGCGFGDFYDFLHSKGIFIAKYVGVDVNAHFIEVATKRHPCAIFFCADVLDFDSLMSIDYVFASGIFFLDGLQWEKHFLAVCKKLLSISNIGLGFNLLSAIEARRENLGERFSKPWEILELVMAELSPKVVLRHDYRTNDFTIFIYKECR